MNRLAPYIVILASLLSLSCESKYHYQLEEKEAVEEMFSELRSLSPFALFPLHKFQMEFEIFFRTHLAITYDSMMVTTDTLLCKDFSVDYPQKYSIKLNVDSSYAWLDQDSIKRHISVQSIGTIGTPGFKCIAIIDREYNSYEELGYTLVDRKIIDIESLIERNLTIQYEFFDFAIPHEDSNDSVPSGEITKYVDALFEMNWVETDVLFPYQENRFKVFVEYRTSLFYDWEYRVKTRTALDWNFYCDRATSGLVDLYVIGHADPLKLFEYPSTCGDPILYTVLPNNFLE